MRRIMRAAQLASASVVAFSSLLSLALVPAASAATYTCTWTGTAGDDKFSTASNWSGCNSTAPQAADTNNFVFDNTSLSSSDVLNNDITGLKAASITFSGSGTHSYTFDGNSFTLSGNITDTTTTGSSISADMVLAGNPTVSVSTSFLDLSGVISGTGNVTKTGAGSVSFDGANTFTGSTTASAGQVIQDNNASFGPASNNVTINDGADLTVSCDATDLPNNVTLSGASSNPSGQYPTPKLLLGNICGGGGGADETYGGYVYNGSLTITGNITLNSDVTLGSVAKTTTLTGTLSGSHAFTLPSNWGGQIIVASSNNTSGMPNGTYNPATVTQTLSDDQSSHSVEIDGNAVITVDGKRGDTNVFSGGVLKGTGTVGALNVASGATVAPGHSPGCMNTGNLTENGTYQVQIGGATPCTEYDQLKVTGTVDVTNGTLDVERYNNFSNFTAGQSFTIIDNDGTDAVTGTFSGLPEGATFKLDNGTVLGITYQGGDGNDVVLSVKNVPATPDTGFGALTAHPLTTALVTTMAAAGIAGLAYRYRKVSIQR